MYIRYSYHHMHRAATDNITVLIIAKLL